MGSAWRGTEGFGWVWVPLGVAVDGTQTHPGWSGLDPKCDDRPSSSMCCPDGVGQGRLGLGVAVCSGLKKSPLEGKREVCVERLPEENGRSPMIK